MMIHFIVRFFLTSLVIRGDIAYAQMAIQIGKSKKIVEHAFLVLIFLKNSLSNKLFTLCEQLVNPF